MQGQELPTDLRKGPLSTFVLSIGTGWDRFWFSRFDPISAGLFRIAVGSLILLMFLYSYPNWDRFYAVDGILQLDLNVVQRVSIPLDTVNVFYWTDGILPTGFWWWVATLASLGFVLGAFTRSSTVILYVMMISIVNRNRLITNGDDLVFRMLMFHALFAPLGHELSLDRWWRVRRGLPQRTAPMIWPVRMLQINILMVYVVSTHNKIFDDIAWTNGMAIYWTMASDMWSRELIPWVSYKYGFLFTRLGTYGSLLIEGLFPILVWVPRTRAYVILALVSLHVGIMCLVPNVAFFTMGMAASLTIFVPPESLRSAISWFRERPWLPSPSDREKPVK